MNLPILGNNRFLCRVIMVFSTMVMASSRHHHRCNKGRILKLATTHTNAGFAWRLTLRTKQFQTRPIRSKSSSSYYLWTRGIDKYKTLNHICAKKTTTELCGGGGVDTSILFNGTPFWISQKIFLGFNLLGFLFSLVTTKQYHVDLLGTGAFAAAAIPSFLSAKAVRAGEGVSSAISGGSAAARIFFSALAVTVWSTKLALFLLYRCIDKGGIDTRLLQTLTVPQYSAGFWTISLLWGVICSLPHTLGATSSLPVNPLFLAVGAAFAGVGLGTETLADYQKWSFKRLPINRNKFCNKGLWSLTQHPNYFGNLLFWVGILMMNAPALIEPLPQNVATAASIRSKLKIAFHHLWRFRRFAISLLSPIFMWYLFNGQATGTILGEELEKRRIKYGYGTDPAYTEYVDNTPLIFPFSK